MASYKSKYTGEQIEEAIDKINTMIASNPNLLINPNFKINQRGTKGVVSTVGYFVDRWQLVNGSAEITANGIVLNGTIKQILENDPGTSVTASASAGTASYDNNSKTFTLTASGMTIQWAKLEIGGTATRFTPPDPSTELLKCQRYFFSGAVCFKMKTVYYSPGICTVLMQFPTMMRINPIMSVFSTQGTPKTISRWDDTTDTSMNDIIATNSLPNVCTTLRSPGGKFISNDDIVTFRYTADAEIY